MAKKKPTDPPEVVELFELIAELYPDADGFDGVLVRNVGANYASKNNFYSGAGAAKTGGRWNPRGLEAIYTSLDVETATLEAYQDFIFRGFLLTAITPRVTAGAKVTLGKVLDLSDPQILKKIGFTAKELTKSAGGRCRKRAKNLGRKRLAEVPIGPNLRDCWFLPQEK